MNIKIEVKEDNKRLDALISSEVENSRSHIQKLITDGFVTINEKVETSKKYKAKIGDIIELEIPEPEPLNVEAEDIKLDIVYEDDELLIVNKPVGMVVHPAPGNYSGTLVNALMNYSDHLSSINGIIRPGIVHRIDKDTSGLLMIAKTNHAHNHLSAQLKAHTIKREYIAIVHGKINEEKGTIKAPIGRSSKDRLKMAVTEKNSREATTHFTVIERFKNYTFIQCRLETGRTHQIRVHLSYISHPLVGDLTYGIKKPKIKNNGQLLHAKTLGFIHPKTEEYIEFDSEVPELFNKILHKIKSVDIKS